MKKALAAAVALLLLSGVAYAEQKKIGSWVKNLTYKLNISTKDEKRPASGALAGVKGAEEKGGESIYWKKGDIPKAEADAFAESLKLIEDGQNDKAKESLEKFLAAYPKSKLANDAKEGLALLASEESGPK